MKLILLELIIDSWVESMCDPRKYPHLPEDKIPFKSLVIEGKTADGESIAIILPVGMMTMLEGMLSKWDRVISKLAELKGLEDEIKRISKRSLRKPEKKER